MNEWPTLDDGLVGAPDDPPGWHARETTPGGYPLMGSSPAERAERVRRAARIKAQAMRDHPFEGEADRRYCQRWRVLVDRMTGSGRLVMRDQCGYPRDLHPGVTS